MCSSVKNPRRGGPQSPRDHSARYFSTVEVSFPSRPAPVTWCAIASESEEQRPSATFEQLHHLGKHGPGAGMQWICPQLVNIVDWLVSSNALRTAAPVIFHIEPRRGSGRTLPHGWSAVLPVFLQIPRP